VGDNLCEADATNGNCNAALSCDEKAPGEQISPTEYCRSNCIVRNCGRYLAHDDDGNGFYACYSSCTAPDNSPCSAGNICDSGNCVAIP